MIEKHNLSKEFPEFKDKIHDMKMENAHFTKLHNEYNELDCEVIKIEEGLENTSDEYLLTLKKQRLLLKDQLHKMLVQ